jgi:hypothetical protein
MLLGKEVNGIRYQDKILVALYCLHKQCIFQDLQHCQPLYDAAGIVAFSSSSTEHTDLLISTISNVFRQG